jgi:hypothetical protein
MQLGSLLITIVNKDHCTLIAVHSVQCFVSGLSRRSCGRCSAYGKGGTQLLIAYTEPLFTHWIVFVLWLPLVKSSNRRLRIHHCYACVIFIYIYTCMAGTVRVFCLADVMHRRRSKLVFNRKPLRVLAGLPVNLTEVANCLQTNVRMIP